jgi:hypothetical protein
MLILYGCHNPLTEFQHPAAFSFISTPAGSKTFCLDMESSGAQRGDGCSKCGAFTYWRPLVNPSVLRDLRLDTYFNFTFRFQPFILQKEVVLG